MAHMLVCCSSVRPGRLRSSLTWKSTRMYVTSRNISVPCAINVEGHTWAMLFDELEYRYVNSLYRGCEYIPAGMGTAGGGGGRAHRPLITVRGVTVD